MYKWVGNLLPDRMAMAGRIKKLNYQSVLDKANTYYVQAKIQKKLFSPTEYTAPEMYPQIESDQVKSILKALIEELNK